MEDTFIEEMCSVQQSDKTVLQNISKMGEKLKELNEAMLKAEAEYNVAKKAYEHYANVLLPQEMFSCGLNRIDLISGGSIKLKHNFYCQPNKNAADKKIIADWLRVNGGSHLIKSDITVASADADILKENNISYIENTSINTTSLKAFLKDKIGATTGIQQLSINDIPDCIHFQEVTTVELEANYE